MTETETDQPRPTRRFQLPPHNHEKAQQVAIWVSILLFALSTGWNVYSRIYVQKDTSASIGEVIDSIEQACEKRHVLTVQYQVRAKNQRILARAQLITTQAFLTALEESPPPPPETTREELNIRKVFIRHYEAAIPRLKHILKTTKILPLEDCKKQAEELRAGQPSG